MFAVYTPQGRTFYGTLESLRRVEKASGSLAVRKVSGATEENSPSRVQGQLNPYLPNAEAAREYARARQKEGQREAVHHAHQVMSTPVEVLMASWTIERVAAAFAGLPYQVFPIVDDSRQLVGSLSRCDFYRYQLDNGTAETLAHKTLGQCFITPEIKVYCADPVTDIRRIARLLVEKKLPAVPIVEDTGHIVGLVSRTDILSSAVSDPPLSLWA